MVFSLTLKKTLQSDQQMQEGLDIIEKLWNWNFISSLLLSKSSSSTDLSTQT